MQTNKSQNIVNIEKDNAAQSKTIKTEKGLVLLLQSVGVKKVEKVNTIKKKVITGTKKVNTNTDKGVYGPTKPTNIPLRESVEPTKVVKGVTLVGKLHIGSNPKTDPSKLIIGKTYVYFGHYLDKDKYNNKTVLVKADLEGPTLGRQVTGAMIVNIQQIRIIKTP
jgi:hypothetical protein